MVESHRSGSGQIPSDQVANSDLGLNSHVEVTFPGNQRHAHGIIRWWGFDNAKAFKYGVEITDGNVQIGTDGIFFQERLFQCAHGRGFLVLPNQVHPCRALGLSSGTDARGKPKPFSRIEYNKDGFIVSNVTNVQKIEQVPEYGYPHLKHISPSSVVAVTRENTDQLLFGTVHWMGAVDDMLCFGIELEVPVNSGTNGIFDGQELFHCHNGCGILAPHFSVHSDPRLFIENKVVTRTDDELTVTGNWPPPQTPHTGLWKGIQGDKNSCYLDSTLFAMFAYTNFYDCMLRAEWNEGDPLHNAIRDTLRDCVVNVLRKRGVVYCNKMTELRQLLDKVGSQVKVSGITSDEKDPEEVLNLILTRAHGLLPFVKFIMKSETSVREIRQDCFLYQIFIAVDKQLHDPTVQQLLETSLHQANLTMTEVPTCLMLQTPRQGRGYRLFDRILPKSSIDVTNLMTGTGVQHCKQRLPLTTRECREALGTNLSAADTTFCHEHFYCSHKPPLSPDDPVHKLNSGDICAMSQIKSEPLTLTAILCIEKSHYVAFVRTGPQQSDPWVFFDSMADRDGGQNIPHVTEVPWLNSWLEDPGSKPPSRLADPQQHQRRILDYAYMYIYHNFKSSVYDMTSLPSVDSGVSYEQKETYV